MNKEFFYAFKTECDKVLAEQAINAEAISSKINAWDVYYTVCAKSLVQGEFFLKKFHLEDEEIRFAMQNIFRNVDWIN